MDEHEQQQSGISRRTVTTTMAWAVPAIAVAASIPIAAASALPSVTFDWGGGCLGSGGITGTGCEKTAYAVQMPCTVSNPTPNTLVFNLDGTLLDLSTGATVSVTSVLMDTGTQSTCPALQTGCTTPCGGAGVFVCVPAGGTSSLWLVFNPFNAQPGVIKGNLNYQWRDTNCNPGALPSGTPSQFISAGPCIP